MEHDRQDKHRVVLIASEAVLTAWSARTAPTGEVIGVCDADARAALDVITHRQPRMVVLEEGFACTERGAALVGRLQTDPAFRHIDIRLLSSERVAQMSHSGATVSLAALAHPLRPLYPTARRTGRRRLTGEVKTEVNGHSVTLVDLSASGAQVLSAVMLRPTQRVRVVLADSIRIEAKVAWVAFEMRGSTAAPRYRAGLEFVHAETEKLNELFSQFLTPDEEATRARHRA